MKVFLSWSGERSKQVASALRDWLPNVIQSMEPWMSATDIRAGAQWNNVLMKQLNETGIEIICLTKDNYNEPYILFEAGALAKTFDKDPFVCPYLIDHTLTEFHSLPAPLSQFQAKEANEKGTRELIEALNNFYDNNRLSGDRLTKAFNKWWPELELKLNEIPKRKTDDIFNDSECVKPQIDGFISLESKFDSNYTFNVYKLDEKQKLPNQKQLFLNWVTFGKGIEHLKSLISNASGIEPNIFFGINEAGIMIASYLSYFHRRAPLGVIKTGTIDNTGKREPLQTEFPNLEDPKCIAVVDSEIKRGRSIKDIFDMLKNRYKNARIIYIVLTGVVKLEDKYKNDLSIKNFGWDVTKKYKPDFLAFYISLPGFEPPGGIR